MWLGYLINSCIVLFKKKLLKIVSFNVKYLYVVGTNKELKATLVTKSGRCKALFILP